LGKKKIVNKQGKGNMRGRKAEEFTRIARFFAQGEKKENLSVGRGEPNGSFKRELDEEGKEGEIFFGSISTRGGGKKEPS